jgi:membrane protease subunit (stomatin/prohibitin family)
MYHHTFALPPVKVKDAKGGAQCIAHAKSFRFIQDLDAKFLPKFRRAINEVVSNKNFCGKDLFGPVLPLFPAGCY